MSNPFPPGYPPDALSAVRKDIFRRLLTALWLRPERALWDAHELAAVANLLGPEPESRSLEYGCTEGTNTFVMLGGAFGTSYDDYRELSGRASPPKSGDIFDTGERVLPLPADGIRARPAGHFDVGVSWREAHVRKAARLGIYAETAKVELNQPLTQFPDGHFALIWSPNLFWSQADELERMLLDHRRLLRKQGRIVTIFPDESQIGCMLYPPLRGQVPDNTWLEALDRGVTENTLRHARSYADWESYFGTRGLRISRHDRFLPETVSRVYQVGFRPFFPVLQKMYEALEAAGADSWAGVKEHWIETAFHFLSPLCENEWMDKAGNARAWHVFELRHAEEKP